MPESRAEPPTGTEGTQSDRARNGSSLIRVEFPTALTPFVWLAMIVGLLLVTATIVCLYVKLQLGAVGNLLVSAGLAIILAAFGGQATIRGKIYVLAGVSGLAFILFTTLEYQRTSDERNLTLRMDAQSKTYTRGFIHEIAGKDYEASLKFSRNVVGWNDIYNNQFSFVVFHDEAKEAETASFRLDPKVEDGKPTISIAIPTACIQENMGKDKPLDWSIRKKGDTVEIVDRRNGNRTIGKWGEEFTAPCSQSHAASRIPPETLAWTLWGWSASAQALTNANTSTAGVNVKQLASDLEADDTSTRRSARDALSAASPQQIQDVLAIAGKDSASYRAKLGVAVALTEMLRRDKSQKDVIAASLTDDHRRLLVELAGHPDRTLRIYATEFLFDLGDPRAAKLAIERAANTDDDNARYNWILSATDGWRRLDPDAKRDLKPLIDALNQKSGPRTKQLLGSFGL